MFNFTTTTFINSDKYLNGEYRYKAVEGGYADGTKVVHIHSNAMEFDDKTTAAVYHRKGDYGKVAEATVSGTIDADKYYRLALYVRLSMGDQNALYANDFVFKGKPLYVEFKGDQKVSDIAKKYQLALYDKDILKISQESVGGDITVKGVNVYQRLTRVELQELQEGVGTLGATTEVWKKVAEATVEDGTLTPNREDFGTYHQLTKDMVLPTFEHRHWGANQADEQPVPGVLYDEFVVVKCAKRDNPLGLGAVGEMVMSKTTHVFFVNQTLAEEFSALFSDTLGVEVEEVEDPEGYPFGESFVSSGDTVADAATNIVGQATGIIGSGDDQEEITHP